MDIVVALYGKMKWRCDFLVTSSKKFTKMTLNRANEQTYLLNKNIRTDPPIIRSNG